MFAKIVDVEKMPKDLRALTHSKKFTYTAFGIAFGSLFPLASLMFRESQLFYVISTAPLVLGIVFLMFGIKQERHVDLEQSKKLFQSLFDSSPFPCMVFSEDGILDCNLATVAILRAQDKPTVLSKHPAIFSPEFQPDGTLSSVKSLEMDRLAKENGFHRFEWMHRTLDGRDLPVEVSLKPMVIEESVVLLVQWKDLTEEKRTRATLESAISEVEFYRFALDKVAMVATTDNKGIITFANDKQAEISGYTKEELIGVDHNVLNSGIHSAEFFRQLWETISSGKIWQGEICHRSKSGRTYWVETTIIPNFDANGVITQYTSIRFEITERKQAEERLELALQNTKMGVWNVDLQTKKVWRTKNHDLLYGYSADLPEWDGPVFRSHLHEDDRARAEAELASSTKEDISKTRCRIRLHGTGEIRWVDIITKVVRSKEGTPIRTIGTTQDITEQVELDSLMQDSRRRLEEAEITGRFGSWELDLKTMQRTFSKGLKVLYQNNLAPKEESFEEIISRIHPEDRHIPQRALRALLENPRLDLDSNYRIQWDNGSIRHIKGYGKAVLDENGTAIKIRGTAQDITELKVMEEKLIANREEALSATRAKSAFLANMSHEIRTPMNGIIGMTSLLIGSSTDPDQIERLQIIQNCGNSLLGLINDVLDFSKLEADKIELEKLPFGLHAVTKEIVELLNTRASEKGLALSYKSDENMPAWILGDVTRFRQILTNLVSNALKFTEVGSVAITSRALKKADGFWEIEYSVKDTGIGIRDEVKTKLFRSFSQVDASTTRRFGGSGLGLAISKGLVERMGGSIWLDSTPGEGSKFSFSFQAQECAVEAATPITNPFSSVDPLMGKKHPLRILVAEDNRTNQIVAVGFLAKLGYQADVAVNGVEALASIAQKPYDLVLMDCHMPEMDGFEATRAIVSLYGQNRPKVMALTASTMKEDIDSCYQSGMDGVIAKPVSLQDLVEVLGACKPRFQKISA